MKKWADMSIEDKLDVLLDWASKTKSQVDLMTEIVNEHSECLMEAGFDTSFLEEEGDRVLN